ncbi:hypothetical protein AMTR_s00119p00090670, partial [Amborella trichopoda]
ELISELRDSSSLSRRNATSFSKEFTPMNIWNMLPKSRGSRSLYLAIYIPHPPDHGSSSLPRSALLLPLEIPILEPLSLPFLVTVVWKYRKVGQGKETGERIWGVRSNVKRWDKGVEKKS